MIACDRLRRFCAITHDIDFVIKRNYANLTVASAIGHPFNLGVNRGLHTLNSRYISHSTLSIVHELFRAIAKISHHLGL